MFFFLFLFLPPNLRTRWTELNDNWPHGRKSVQFENACQKSGVSPPPTNRGSDNHLFERLCNSTETLTAYRSLERNTVYTSGQVRCKLQGVSYIILKRHELWSTNGFKLEVSFYPSFVNSAFHFIARLRRRKSANGTQPNSAKRWTVNRANNPP